MNGYLSNIVLRGSGSYSMDPIRPRRGIFEPGNVTAPLIHSSQDRSPDEPNSYHNLAEPLKQVIRDIPSSEVVEDHPATLTTPPGSLPTHSLSEPILDYMAAPTVSSNQNTPGASRQEMRNVETEPLPDEDHAMRPALNPKLSVHSARTIEPASQLNKKRQLGVQEPRQDEVVSKTPKKEAKTGRHLDDSAVPELSPLNDAAEEVKRYWSINNNSATDAATNYQKQPYTKNEQKIIKPAAPSTFEQTRISPVEQTSFTKMRPAKKTASQSESQQTVKVKIGKVEVRAVQTPEPPSAPQQQAPVRSGFVDYLSVRNYDFPEY